MSLAAIFILCVLSFVLKWGHTLWLAVAAVVITIIMLLVKLWQDNRHLCRSLPRLTSLLCVAFVLWLPFGLLLVPAFFVTRWLDTNVLERGVGWMERQVSDRIKQVEEVNEQTVRESVSHWYKPWTWGDMVERKVRETVVRDVVERASFGTRLFFGLVYALLRCLQYFYYAGFALVVVRSFGYVLARAAVRRGVGLDFTLPIQR